MVEMLGMGFWGGRTIAIHTKKSSARRFLIPTALLRAYVLRIVTDTPMEKRVQSWIKLERAVAAAAASAAAAAGSRETFVDIFAILE